MIYNGVGYIFAAKLFYRLAVSLIIFMLALSKPVFADVKDITATGEYNMSESETLLVAKERAVVIAMRSAVEQAGIYLESYSQVKNMQITKDEINMIASGIIEITDKKFDRKITDTGGDFIKVIITCKVNTDSVQSQAAKLHDKSTVENLQKVQSDYDKAMQEIALLKQQLAQSKTVQEKQLIESKISQNEQSFTATQWFEKGYYYQVKYKDYDNAILAYSKAIELNPQYFAAYGNRGGVYKDKGQLDLALADYAKAIKLNPDNSYAYYNRGIVYADIGQYLLAIADYTKAIELNPGYAIAYYNRGNAYNRNGRSDLALPDYNKAIELNPQYASTYVNRGNIYKFQSRFDLAMADYNKAIELNPQSAIPYINRGTIYHNKAQYDLAIADYNKAIELNPQSASAYYNKGLACVKSGRNAEAIESYKSYLKYAPAADPYIEEAKKQIGQLNTIQ